MKLSFSKLGTHGRLGNQLFQIASTIGLGTHYKAEVAFPEWKYEWYFTKDLPHGEIQNILLKEKHGHYHDWDILNNNEQLLGFGEGYDIIGYLQSEFYFEFIADKIKEQFTFKPEFIEGIKKKLPEDLFDKETIILQVRRGDYVNNPNYYQLPITFYIDSLITYFPNWEDCNLIFLSDDLAYCKVHFECLPNAYFTDGFSDIEQIAIASLCNHFIIANSSFGWWAAWLGEKENSKIIHCGYLQAGKLLEANNPETYYPKRWTENKKENYKINLQDVTFTIPVLYDSKDRKQNLDLCVCLLQKNFETNIIIGEQGGDKFQYMDTYCQYIRFEGMDKFHRTKMLNVMAEEANTPYLANWDADVLIPPMQVYLTVMRLKQGIDMCFPYDGRFVRLSRYEWFKPIEKLLDIGAITEHKIRKSKPIPESSVGGAVFFNKDSFIDGGMENENMISFAPEDCERNDRFNKLDFKVERVNGCLYHIDHWIGENSSNKNPWFKHNHAELEYIRELTKEQLQEYIDTWEWRNKYTELYYKRISKGAIRSAKEVYKELERLEVYWDSCTVIDVGCGIGEWGVDVLYYTGLDYNIPKKSLLILPQCYIECNLEKDIYINPSPQKYDLCLCLEVLEHISEERADEVIKMLCQLSDTILFSAAIPYQGGTGHVNEQWQTYWARKFSYNGFWAVKQPNIQGNKNIELWYRQNIVLYKNSPPFHHLHPINDFVLPEYYLEIVKNLKNIK